MERYVDFMEEIMKLYRADKGNKATQEMLDFSFKSDILSKKS
jgi:hypothetical protein